MKRLERIGFGIFIVLILAMLVYAYGGSDPAVHGHDEGELLIDAIPSGAIMHFNLNSCPDGWTELTSAKGRYIVGIDESQAGSGELNQIVGTALSAQEARATGSHYHSVNPPNTATTSNGNHRHGVTERFGDYSSGLGGGGSPVNYYSQTINTGYAGTHSHTVDIGNFNSGSTGTSTTPAPYIQFLICQKD